VVERLADALARRGLQEADPPSSPATAMVVASGENATAWVRVPVPSGARTGRPVAGSQREKSPGPPTAASLVPSGL
jgi:hypothetical protein